MPGESFLDRLRGKPKGPEAPKRLSLEEWRPSEMIGIGLPEEAKALLSLQRISWLAFERPKSLYKVEVDYHVPLEKADVPSTNLRLQVLKTPPFLGNPDLLRDDTLIEHKRELPLLLTLLDREREGKEMGSLEVVVTPDKARVTIIDSKEPREQIEDKSDPDYWLGRMADQGPEMEQRVRSLLREGAGMMEKIIGQLKEEVGLKSGEKNPIAKKWPGLGSSTLWGQRMSRKAFDEFLEKPISAFFTSPAVKENLEGQPSSLIDGVVALTVYSGNLGLLIDPQPIMEEIQGNPDSYFRKILPFLPASGLFLAKNQEALTARKYLRQGQLSKAIEILSENPAVLRLNDQGTVPYDWEKRPFQLPEETSFKTEANQTIMEINLRGKGGKVKYTLRHIENIAENLSRLTGLWELKIEPRTHPDAVETKVELAPLASYNRFLASSEKLREIVPEVWGELESRARDLSKGNLLTLALAAPTGWGKTTLAQWLLEGMAISDREKGIEVYTIGSPKGEENLGELFVQGIKKVNELLASGENVFFVVDNVDYLLRTEAVRQRRKREGKDPDAPISPEELEKISSREIRQAVPENQMRDLLNALDEIRTLGDRIKVRCRGGVILLGEEDLRELMNPSILRGHRLEMFDGYATGGIVTEKRARALIGPVFRKLTESIYNDLVKDLKPSEEERRKMWKRRDHTAKTLPESIVQQYLDHPAIQKLIKDKDASPFLTASDVHTLVGRVSSLLKEQIRLYLGGEIETGEPSPEIREDIDRLLSQMAKDVSETARLKREAAIGEGEEKVPSEEIAALREQMEELRRMINRQAEEIKTLRGEAEE